MAVPREPAGPGSSGRHAVELANALDSGCFQHVSSGAEARDFRGAPRLRFLDRAVEVGRAAGRSRRVAARRLLPIHRKAVAIGRPARVPGLVPEQQSGRHELAHCPGPICLQSSFVVGARLVVAAFPVLGPVLAALTAINQANGRGAPAATPAESPLRRVLPGSDDFTAPVKPNRSRWWTGARQGTSIVAAPVSAGAERQPHHNEKTKSQQQ
jgi:hypothetical protein